MKPKVFISYCQSSPTTETFVRDLVDELERVGIIPVWDKGEGDYDLKYGQSLVEFMQKLKKDEEFHKILVVSDSEYKRKAENNEGGVGIETQILSPDVYKDLEQTKVVPIFLERDENSGNPSLPHYLENRYAGDFANGKHDFKKLIDALCADFKPSDSVTQSIASINVNRAQLAYIVAHGCGHVCDFNEEPDFADVAKVDFSFQEIHTLWRSRIMKGFVQDDRYWFYPNLIVTRIEAIQVIVDAAQLPLTEDSPFEDTPSEKDYQEYLSTAYSWSVIELPEDHLFHSMSSVTLDDLKLMLKNALDPRLRKI